MRKVSFKGCKSQEEIEARIKESLKYETVAENEEAAEQWFAENFGSSSDEVRQETVQSENVSVWNEEMNGEEVYHVCIAAHYIDPGSVDYIYTYSVEML